MTRARRVLPELQCQAPERGERLDLGAAILQRTRYPDCYLVPRPSLQQAACPLLEPSGVQQGRHRAAPIPALLGLERRDVGFVHRLEVLRDALKRLRHVAPQFVGLDTPLAQREVRAGTRP